MSPTKFKNKCDHKKATYLINILILDKMWNKNNVAIAACVIFNLEAKKASIRDIGFALVRHSRNIVVMV
jgi:hypothetical protein